MPIGQDENIRSFEVDLGLFVGDEFRPEQYSPLFHALSHLSPEGGPITFAVFGSPRDNQAIIVMPGKDLLKSGDEVFEPLVRCDVAEKKDRLFTITDVQPLLRLDGRETCVRNRIVDPKGDDGDARSWHVELLDEFELHLFRMNEDVVGKPILDS